MKHKRLGEKADLQQIKALLKENNPGWKQPRLTALKIGFLGEIPLEFIAESVGVSASTLRRWFATFRRDGLDAVLSRRYGIGRPSGLPFSRSAPSGDIRLSAGSRSLKFFVLL